jgi:hypothetical protein
MENAREPLIRFFRDLVAIFGRTGAEILICVFVFAILVIAVLALVFGRMVLQFGEATFGGAARFILEGFRVFKYQPSQKTHPSIRLELYFDNALITIIILCVLGLLAHALVPWVPERIEHYLIEISVSSAILFGILIGVSITMAARLPQD